MARSAEQLLEKMKRSPHGYGDQDMMTVLVGHGFRYREGNKHTVYQHKTHADLTISVPRHRDLRAWVSRDVVRLIETLAQREKE